MTRTAACLLLSVLAIAPACDKIPTTDFPYGMSLDKHNFVSTVHRPLSLTLVDTVTGETLWELDVPVGRMAVVDFEREDHWNSADLTPGGPASKVLWGIMEPTKTFEFLDQSQELSGNPVMLKVAIRDREAAPMQIAPPMETPPLPPASPLPPQPDADAQQPEAAPAPPLPPEADAVPEADPPATLAPDQPQPDPLEPSEEETPPAEQDNADGDASGDQAPLK